MKGIVFTEFLEFVEDHHGILVVDKIINNSDLKSGGIYTTVGTYEHHEIVQLVTQLSSELNIDINTLLGVYGEHFFNVLLNSYPSFFDSQTDCFDFLSTVDNYIHPEVLKLYHDAELPRFYVEEKTDKDLVLIYSSERGMYTFAEGLMKGCLAHFKDESEIKSTLLDEHGKRVKFHIKRN